MKVHFTGRQVDISQAMKDFVTEKLDRISRYWTSVEGVNVTLSVEKYRHIAEISVQGKPFSLNGVEVTNDMYASVGAVMDKLERQAKKQKEKLWDRKKRRGNKEAIRQQLDTLGPEGAEGEAEHGEEMALEGAEEESEEAESSTGHADPSSPRVVRTHSFEVKPMSVEEAVLSLGGSRREFVVFRNADSEKVNVLYRRSDGDFGLIEPTV